MAEFVYLSLSRDRFLSEGMLFIRDLPYKVSSDDLMDFFSSYGEVLTAERSVAAKYPDLCNGNRIIKMVLDEDLPYFLSVCGCQCRVWYRGPSIQCFVCRELGHRAQSCPLSGRCRYCHQVGHMARDCAQAWDPPPSAVPDDSSMSDCTTIVERAPETEPDPPADLDNPPDPESAVPSPADPVPAIVSDKPLVDDVPMSKPA